MHPSSSNSLTVRQATATDMAAVSELRNRCFSTSHWKTNDERAAYMRRVFFDNPWRDPAIGPVIALSGSDVVGFVGLLPRKMRFGARQLVGALISQFMVAPEARRRGIGRALLDHAFAGPQDFSFSDIPEPATERIWVAAGGISVPMYKFFWTATLRPFASAAVGLGMRPTARVVRRLAMPGLRLLDSMVVRPDPSVMAKYTMQPLNFDRGLSGMAPLIPADVMRADHTEQGVQWLMGQLVEKWGRENVHTYRIFAKAELAGILIYVVAERVAHVHVLLTRPEDEHSALDCVLDHFKTAGYIAARGRFQPVMLAAFKKRELPFALVGHGLLAQSADNEIMTHVLAGKALFTGLTGEWPLHF